MAFLLLNNVKQALDSTGTGALDVGSAEDGFQTAADAGATNGDTFPYKIEDGAAWEYGVATYNTGSPDNISRSVDDSSDAGSPINASADAVLLAVLRAEDVELANSEILKADTHDTLTAGFDSDAESLGTVTTGTITPEVDGAGEENFKTLTANGAFTLAPPSTSGNCTIIIQVTNGASAGTITASGFTIVNGDDYDTASGNDFLLHIKKVGSFSSLTIEALQ